MIRWSTEIWVFISRKLQAIRTSVSERPVDREFESHQPHLFIHRIYICSRRTLARCQDERRYPNYLLVHQGS